MAMAPDDAVGPGGYPRFSDAEFSARARRLDELLAERGVEHVIVYGANRFGSGIAWLSGWPVTREAMIVHTPGQRDLLLVGFYNHVPNARRLAATADVEWIGEDPIATATAELRRRGAVGRSVGVIGPLPHRAFARFGDFAGATIDMSRDYARLRLRKSQEEIEWTRIGAELTDAAVGAICARAVPGVTEPELADAAERAYVARGGTTHIHYFGATPMADPQVCVPAQWPSDRRLHRGDALVCEVSASWWGYTGQLLRTFAIDTEPTPLYRELHDVADAAFDAIIAAMRPGATAADLVAASGVIEDAGYTIRDDLVHGFVGGYLPPVLGSRSRTLGEIPEFTLQPGMMVVVQPNVVTRDERAGVQTGELVLVGPSETERVHRFERGLLNGG
jgi:Xaa-Pro dipeptidase